MGVWRRERSPGDRFLGKEGKIHAPPGRKNSRGRVKRGETRTLNFCRRVIRCVQSLGKKKQKNEGSSSKIKHGQVRTQGKGNYADFDGG